MKNDCRRLAKFSNLLFPLLFCALSAQEDAVDVPRTVEPPRGDGPSSTEVAPDESTATDALSIEAPPAPTTSGMAVPSVRTPLPGDLQGRGLLDFRDPFPFAKFHLQLPAAAPPGLRRGETSGLVQFDWSNTSGVGDDFVADVETYTLRLGFWHALRSNFYLGVETAVEGRDGGILDSFVNGFHDTFGIDVSERDQRPKDAYEVVVEDSGGGLKELDRGFGLGNTALKAHWIFSEGRDWWPTLSLQPLLYLPTSTSGFGARGVDLGLALTAQKRVSDHLYLYAVGGGTFLTDPTTEGLRYEEFNYQFTAGIEIVLWWDSVSLVGQYTHYSPLLKDTSGLDRERNYVGGAIKHRILPDVNVIWGFMENLPPLKNTADVTFAMGCEFRF